MLEGVRLVKGADVPRAERDGFFSELVRAEVTGARTLMVGFFRTGAGFKVPPHHHTCETVAHLISGRAAFEIGADLGERVEMEPGDYVCVDEGVIHTEETVGDDPAEFFIARDNGGGETVPVDPEDPFWK